MVQALVLCEDLIPQILQVSLLSPRGALVSLDGFDDAGEGLAAILVEYSLISLSKI